jgi:hypothetical protein
LDCKLCVFFSRVFDFSRPKGMLFTVWLLPARRAHRDWAGYAPRG